MADYKGSTTLISGITQKNGGKFPLVEASAVQFKNEENQDGTFKSVTEKIDEVAEQAGSYEMGSTEDIDSIINSLE